jgi:HD-GYP domain-containing protein (c-di-GMP phosphodiesterase class II)
MTLRQLDRDMLVPGKTIGFDVVDASGRILLPMGTPLADEAQAKVLWTRGFRKEEDSIQISAAPPRRSPSSPWRQRPRSHEGVSNTPKFFQPVERLSFQLEEVFSDLLNGSGARLPERVLEVARAIQIQLGRDADALLAAMELSSNTRYGTLHALHSSALCDLVATSQGIPSDDRRILIAAALTRDVGFLELQDDLDLQSDPLSSQQQDLVRMHPLASAQILRDAAVRDPIWLSAVEQHHERLNGSGYPRGIAAEAVEWQACLLGIADIYSAMTKPRAYRAAIQGPNAIHSIFQTRGSLVDEACTQSFIRTLGVYSPGLLVRLASREIGVVVRRTENLKVPEIRVVADPDGKLLQIYPARDVSNPAYGIAEALPRANPLREKLNHRQLWGENHMGLHR